MRSIPEIVSRRTVILAYPEKCTGCRLCEMICSLTKGKSINPSQAYIHITDNNNGIHFPIKCDQCLNAPCVKVCKRNAIFRNKKTGAITFDKWGCNQCGSCISACPFGMISMGEESVVKCDLCNGEPLCATVCSSGALKVMHQEV